jgi:hypothetical protein
MTSLADRVYCDEAYVSIRWNSSGGWVIAEWKGWANSSELRAAYEQALLAVVDNRASKWLLDGRELRAVVEADQRWLADDWVPRMRGAGVRHTAIVRPKSEIATVGIERVQATHNLNSQQRRVFTTLEEAEEWLLKAPLAPG